MNAFINFLSTITLLPAEVQQAINDITILRKKKKGDLLLRNGEICREFHFLAKGFARVYYLKDGKDITAWFTGEGGIVSAIDSLFTQKPSIYHIEILEDSEVYSLQFDKLEPVFEKHPVVERLGRLLVTSHYLLLDERMKLFVFCTAEERYSKLLQQFPDILEKLKLGYIASYLGITQEHLSRIRNLY